MIIPHADVQSSRHSSSHCIDAIKYAHRGTRTASRGLPRPPASRARAHLHTRHGAQRDAWAALRVRASCTSHFTVSTLKYLHSSPALHGAWPAWTAGAMAVPCAMCARDVQMMDSTASWRWDWVRFWRFGATLLAA